MGNHCSKKNPIKSIADPYDEIGKSRVVKNSCVPSNSSIQYMESFIPNNGEYIWSGNGKSCYNCEDGHQIEYVRQNYKADPSECCISNRPMIGNLTCDPKYRNIHSSYCHPTMENYCNNRNNIFSEKCNSWCSENKEICSEISKKFCSTTDLEKDPECMNWCMNNMGKCDHSMIEYCKNKNEPKCSCLNSYIEKTKHNPLCVDEDCIRDGYQTVSMMNARGNGCEFIDCGSYFDIKSKGKVNFNDVKIEQRCSGDSIIKDTVKQEQFDLLKYRWWIAFFGILLLFLILIK